MIPVQITILNEIKERLESISFSNGYNHSIVSVERKVIENFTGRELPIIFYNCETDTLEQNSTGQETRSLALSITGFARTVDDNHIDKAVALGFDIYTALNRDVLSKKPDDTTDNQYHTIEKIDVELIDWIVGKGDDPYYGCLVSGKAYYSIIPGKMSYG